MASKCYQATTKYLLCEEIWKLSFVIIDRLATILNKYVFWIMIIAIGVNDNVFRFLCDWI